VLARIRKAMDEKDEGFTLIELLVVIIIIGILAAIAIPVFLNQRKKGYDAQTKSDVKNLVTSMETYATDTNGVYPATGSLTNAAAIHTTLSDWTKSANDTSVVAEVTGTTGSSTYVIAAKSDSNAVFCYRSDASGKGVYKSVAASPSGVVADCPPTS
jgi:type IV pilus assembly protein PilA